MAGRYSARRYARAVFEIALEREELDEWQSGLERIARLSQDETITAFMASPDISFKDKASALREILGDHSLLMKNLLYLLISRGRFNMLADIVAEYQRFLDDHYDIERASIATAVPLDEEDKKKLDERLGKIIGKKVISDNKVDPGLIGGVVVRVAGKLMDGSTRGKLEALKRVIA
jgi:F-type H+-transporting ATPase subunit delta